MIRRRANVVHLNSHGSRLHSAGEVRVEWRRPSEHAHDERFGVSEFRRELLSHFRGSRLNVLSIHENFFNKLVLGCRERHG